MKSTTVFSFLTTSKESIGSFIALASSMMLGKSGISNHYKYDVYKRNYDIKFRHKYTGFEELSDLDTAVREKLAKHLGDTENIDYYAELDSEIADVSDDCVFREELKRNAMQFSDTCNLIYLSGGLDSEITALAFLDAEIEFTPVIFKWTDKNNNVINDYDTEYAFSFCTENNIVPLVRLFDVVTFWESDEIYEYADKYKISSPQILTYYKMVDVMDEEFDND